MNAETETLLAASKATFEAVADNVRKAVTGHRGAVRMLLAAVASGGHVLLEDYPGTGKTTMAKAIAQSIGADFKRVQFTPDLLPSDILGVSVFDQRDQQFHFREGPVFTHLLLADEVNRASPRTQSALLEAMAEGQVSIEGTTHRLAEPFLVIATQNPIEFRGTYPLPEAQMDRFMVRLSLGYLDAEDEVAMVTAQSHEHPLAHLGACVELADILTLREGVKAIRVSDDLKRYAVELVRRTREQSVVQLGAGPRASIALLRVAQALALFDGQAFVSPDQLHECAIGVMAHRVIVDPQARFAGTSPEAIVEDILAAVPIPT